MARSRKRNKRSNNMSKKKRDAIKRQREREEREFQQNMMLQDEETDAVALQENMEESAQGSRTQNSSEHHSSTTTNSSSSKSHSRQNPAGKRHHNPRKSGPKTPHKVRGSLSSRQNQNHKNRHPSHKYPHHPTIHTEDHSSIMTDDYSSHTSHNPPALRKISLQWTHVPVSDDSIVPPNRHFHSSCLVETIHSPLETRSSSHPSPKSPPTSVQQSIFIIGGDNGSTFFHDIWMYDVRKKRWSEVIARDTRSNPSSKPVIFSGRCGHSCVYYNHSLWVFGGREFNTYFSDIVRFDLSTRTWNHVFPKKAVRPRAAHTAVVLNGKMYSFGGVTSPRDIDQQHGVEYLNSLVVFDFAQHAWNIPKTRGTPPTSRAGHAMSVNTSENTIYIWGGRTGSSIHLDFFVLNVNTLVWRKIEVKGKSPRPRAGHTLTFVQYAERPFVILYGGVDWRNFFSDLWIFDVNTSEWKRVSQSLSAGHPLSPENDALTDGGSVSSSNNSTSYVDVLKGRSWHTATQCANFLFIFGGTVEKEPLNELIALDLTPLFGANVQVLAHQAPQAVPVNNLPSHNRTPSLQNFESLYAPDGGRTFRSQASNKHATIEQKKQTDKFSSSLSPSTSYTTTSTSANTPTSPPNQLHTFKIKQNSNIYRISAPEDYNELVKLLCKRFHYQDSSQFSLFYFDEENDVITIRSPEDLSECIRSFKEQGKKVKLEIKDVSDTSSNHPWNESSSTQGYSRGGEIQAVPPSPVSMPENMPPTPTTPHSQPTQFQYQIGALLGTGAFGRVYMARNLVTGEDMAVKQIRLDAIGNRRKIMREIELMKRLNHPNIVRYFGAEYDERREILNIFMELVVGGSLHSIAEKRTVLSENMVRQYTRQILLGLQYLHSGGIIHRDIKGANILLSIKDGGVVKLADFGQSKDLNATISMNSVGFKGTPLWMAPRVIRGEPQNKFSDIWSVGCVILEMCTGRPPWYDELLRKHESLLPYHILHFLGSQSHPPKYPSNLSPEGKHFLDLCFGMQTPVDVLLREPFVNEYPEHLHVAPSSSSPIQEEEEEEAKEDQEFSNYNAMQSYNGLSDLESSDEYSSSRDEDDSRTTATQDEEDEGKMQTGKGYPQIDHRLQLLQKPQYPSDEEYDDYYDEESTFSATSTSTEEEDVSDRILAMRITDEESRITMESLQKQVAMVNKRVNAREQQNHDPFHASQNENANRPRTIARSPSQVLNCFKDQEEKIESEKRTMENLAKRTTRINEKKKKKNSRLLD